MGERVSEMKYASLLVWFLIGGVLYAQNCATVKTVVTQSYVKPVVAHVEYVPVYLDRYFTVPEESITSKKLDTLIELLREQRTQGFRMGGSGVETIFEAKCVSCHKGERKLENYTSHEILVAVSSKEMPPKVSLSDSEIKVIAHWSKEKKK